MINWDDVPIDDEEQQPDEGLFGPDESFRPNWQHWDGMPEFVVEDLEPKFTVIVKFRSAEDRQAFADLIGQPIRGWRGEKAIWFPKAVIKSSWDMRWRDASSDAPSQQTGGE